MKRVVMGYGFCVKQKMRRRTECCSHLTNNSIQRVNIMHNLYMKNENMRIAKRFVFLQIYPIIIQKRKIKSVMFMFERFLYNICLILILF